MSNSPHDNPHWEKQRDERDLTRILEGKPVAENSNLKVTRAPNTYILIFKLLLNPDVRALLWRGLFKTIFNRNKKNQPPDEPTDPDNFPF